MHTHRFFHCLGESTRLYAMLLLHRQEELCVCELVAALEQSQPTISRHLAQLRHCGLVTDERRGQWVYYRLHPSLPVWARAILEQGAAAEEAALDGMQRRLEAPAGAGAVACG